MLTGSLWLNWKLEKIRCIKGSISVQLFDNIKNESLLDVFLYRYDLINKKQIYSNIKLNTIIIELSLTVSNKIKWDKMRYDTIRSDETRLYFLFFCFYIGLHSVTNKENAPTSLLNRAVLLLFVIRSIHHFQAS